MPEFLVFFVHRHFDFRYPELEAVLTLQNLSFRDVVDDTAALPNPESTPLLRIHLPSLQHAKFLSERGILVKGVYEIWGDASGGDYDALIASVAAYTAPIKQQLIDDASSSWRINVDAFGKKLSMAEQRKRRERFADVLPFAGDVVLTADAHETFLILEEIGVEHSQGTRGCASSVASALPKQLFFLREVAGSEKNRGRGGARDLVDKQTLKRRAYIGPTSMESEMALLMANMALVSAGDCVIDPFVGTGSVLIPCGTHGALCFGTDIDIRVLLGIGVGVVGNTVARSATGLDDAMALGVQVDESDGRSARVNVTSNFVQYGLQAPELIRADNSQSPLIHRCTGFFDAVVCDPPYGIRAGARKSGRKPSITKQSPLNMLNEVEKKNYIAPTQPYAAEDVMRDLLTFAAATLRTGGRLVYLLPTTYDYTDADLPTHPLLTVVANSEQKLTTKYARRLITMVKREDAAKTTASEQEGRQPHDVAGQASYANLRAKLSDRYKSDAAAAQQNRKRKSEELVVVRGSSSDVASEKRVEDDA